MHQKFNRLYQIISSNTTQPSVSSVQFTPHSVIPMSVMGVLCLIFYILYIRSSWKKAHETHLIGRKHKSKAMWQFVLRVILASSIALLVMFGVHSIVNAENIVV